MVVCPAIPEIDALTVSSTIRFENVSKRYHLRRNRPRSFRELFVRRGRAQPPQAAEASPSDLWALRDVSFEIQSGETVALVGRNGAGKSTALKLISRIMQPTRGRIQVKGRVAALLELGAGFHPDLSARENVYLSGALAGMGRDEIARKYDAIVAFAELADFMEMPVKHFSSGMFARLAFAVSIHLEPDVLLVDEVLAVGDHSFQLKCLDRIAALHRQGITICVVTHAPETVRQLCSRALWFEHGRLHADGTAEAIVREYIDDSFQQEAERLSHSADRLTAAQRQGNRKVDIHRVRLTNAAGEPTVIFQTGEALIVHMDYRVQQPIFSPTFGIAVHRHDGLHLSGPNTAFSNIDLGPVEHEGTITYTIPYLPLLEGLYHLTVAAVSADDTETYDYHDRAYAFRVANRSSAVKEQYGLLTMRGEWQSAAAPLTVTAPSALER